MYHRLTMSVALSAWAIGGHLQAALVINPARAITDRIDVNVIAVADNDGSDSTAGLLGTSTRREQVFSLVDQIFAQAGVAVDFAMRPGTYNSSFARTGMPGSNNPRPSTDLRDLYQNAAAAGGVLSSDRNTINLFLVTIVPGFSQLGANYSAGIATLAGNGIAFFGGSTLSTYPEGREVLASVLAHEIGHNLGLEHIAVSQNLMQSGGGGQRLNASQISSVLNSRFTVPAPQPSSGDFNNDDIVDGADFLRWQRGQSPSRLSASDLSAWESQFATAAAYSLAAATQTPEPGSMTLAVLACMGLWRVRRRRSKTLSSP